MERCPLSSSLNAYLLQVGGETRVGEDQVQRSVQSFRSTLVTLSPGIFKYLVLALFLPLCGNQPPTNLGIFTFFILPTETNSAERIRPTHPQWGVSVGAGSRFRHLQEHLPWNVRAKSPYCQKGDNQHAGSRTGKDQELSQRPQNHISWDIAFFLDKLPPGVHQQGQSFHEQHGICIIYVNINIIVLRMKLSISISNIKTEATVNQVAIII